MTDMTLGVAAIGVAAIVVLAGGLVSARRRRVRRAAGLRHLLDLADSLEGDLRTCRHSLRQAHAVMSSNPDQSTAGEQEAQNAIDAGLRALLQQRLWIRDHSPHASCDELEQAMHSMTAARQRLQPLMQSLTQAQRDLNSAIHEHIHREPDA